MNPSPDDKDAERLAEVFLDLWQRNLALWSTAPERADTLAVKPGTQADADDA